MSHLKERLLLVEEDFLAALIAGGDALSTFNQQWEDLVAEIDHALDSAILDPEIASLAHDVASRCATLAETSADLFSSYDTLTTELMGELDTLMSELTLHDPTTQDDCPSVLAKHSAQANVMPSIEATKPVSSSYQTSSRKRRVQHDPECPPSSSTRPLKRRRSANPFDWVPNHVAPPPNSVSYAHTLQPSRDSLSRSPSSLSPSASSSGCRKRRASDADTRDKPEKRQRLYIGPRLHAVSDSFASRPTSDCVDEPHYTSGTAVPADVGCVASSYIPHLSDAFASTQPELSSQFSQDASIDGSWPIWTDNAFDVLALDDLLNNGPVLDHSVPIVPASSGVPLESPTVPPSLSFPHTPGEVILPHLGLIPQSQDPEAVCPQLPLDGEFQVAGFDWDSPLFPETYGGSHCLSSLGEGDLPETDWSTIFDSLEWLPGSPISHTPSLSPCPSQRSEDSDDESSSPLHSPPSTQPPEPSTPVTSMKPDLAGTLVDPVLSFDYDGDDIAHNSRLSPSISITL